MKDKQAGGGGGRKRFLYGGLCVFGLTALVGAALGGPPVASLVGFVVVSLAYLGLLRAKMANEIEAAVAGEVLLICVLALAPVVVRAHEKGMPPAREGRSLRAGLSGGQK